MKLEGIQIEKKYRIFSSNELIKDIHRMKKVGDICHKARSDDHRCKYIYGVSF